MSLKKGMIDNVPVVITFLGFWGHMSCMKSISQCVSRNGYRHIEASPRNPSDYSFFNNFFSKIDAYSMKESSIHVGLGSVYKQALASNERLSKKISPHTPVILCGHSQGGLIAIEFWKKFSKKYNIKGIITITSPLQGASIFRSLGSYKILRDVVQRSCCSKRVIKIIPVLVPFILFPIFKMLSRVCCPSIRDILPTKRVIKKNFKNFIYLKEMNLPLLNITATCPAPASFNKMPFGIAGTKEIIGGGFQLKSDNVLGLKDQKMPIYWEKLEEVHVNADHGLYYVAGHEKIFSHKDVLNYIVRFCNNVFV